jgi:DNA helicase II / ATP-dependent DNA helicase PcrA
MGIRPEQVQAAAAVQEAAAADEAECIRVVAGPGTGKSFSIEERVCWLLGQGVEPNAIAAVSFTRASAADLQERVQDACVRAGHPEAGISVTTLHALALRSLRAAGVLEAFPVDPTVLDRWELRNIYDEEFGRVAGVGSITRRREIREDHETFWSTGSYEPPPSQDPPDPPITNEERTAFQTFHGPRTQTYACVLPGELVQRCVSRMDANTLDPVALLGIDHLIVDEFQDLNPMDLRLVYGLQRRGVTLFVAGDDDQSLYSFRYASPAGIQQFTKRFNPVGDHVLRDCFRCTPAVLGAAESLISDFAAPGRIPKEHVSLYSESDPPVEGGFGCWSFDDAADEAEAIAASCRRLIDAGLPPREIMILLSNAQALWWQLRDAFDAFDVPFEPPRSSPFKDTDPGRALFAILRLLGDGQNYVALRTLLRLRRGVGVATAAEITDVTIAQNLNYRDLFYEDLPDVFAARPKAALEQCRDISQDLLDWDGEDTFEDRADEIDQMIARILGAESDERWRDEVSNLPGGTTLKEMERYLAAEKDGARAAVMAEVFERLELEPEEEETTLPARIQVMTMHSAKGLSATVVFVPGSEEQILPSERRARFPGQVLEAARMLYVSITRARVACVVSYASHRFINGQTARHTPSRYTEHLGKPFENRDGGISEDLAGEVVQASEQL